MPTRIFKDIFRNKPLPQEVHSTLNLKFASGDNLKQYCTFMLQMTIRGKIYSHPVIILTNLNDCILGIYFMHKHKISYDALKRQILLDQQFVKTIHATKQIIVPALSSKNTFCQYTIAGSKFCCNHRSTTAQHNIGYAPVGLNQLQNLFDCH